MAKDPRPDCPSDVKRRLDRGNEARDADAGMRNLCLEFTRGNHYLFLGDGGKIYDQRGIAKSQLEPEEFRNRVWQTRNILVPIVGAKVSGASSRVPSYESTPSTIDREDIVAARTTTKVALACYDQWNLRRVTQKAVYFAIVADESFTLPYWDPDVGPYQELGGKLIGRGEVRFRTLHRNQVAWEPGCEYEESPWCSIEYARPMDVLQADPDYLGGELVPDADTQRVANRKRREPNQVLVTEYFERPCPKYPDGRWLVLANTKQIFSEDTYPLQDSNGTIDEPLLHRLSYLIDPDADSDMGLVRHLIDAQRTFEDAVNKQLELKNLSLLPQLLAPRGSVQVRPTTTPGAIVEYDPTPGGGVPQWRPAPDPQILNMLQSIAESAKADAGYIADANAVPSQVESGKGIQTLIERDQLAWQRFIADVAGWHSGLMRDALLLVQRYYDEPRMMRYIGRSGAGVLEAFRGADLRGQTDVRVRASSIEPYTKQALEQKVMNLVQAFPNYFPPEVVMSALEGGSAEKLIEDYELDVDRANAVIRTIEKGPEALFSLPPRPALPEEQINPDGTPKVDELGQPILTVPEYMPRPFDRVGIWRSVFESWMKTSDWDALAPDMKEVSYQIYGGLLDIEARQAERAAQLQSQQAAELGMENATKPSGNGASPLPSLPAIPGP